MGFSERDKKRQMRQDATSTVMIMTGCATDADLAAWDWLARYTGTLMGERYSDWGTRALVGFSVCSWLWLSEGVMTGRSNLGLPFLCVRLHSGVNLVVLHHGHKYKTMSSFTLSRNGDSM